MTAFQFGETFAFTCAFVVAVCGILFIRTRTTTGFDFAEHIRDFARDILVTISAILIAIGLMIAVSAISNEFLKRR